MGNSTYTFSLNLKLNCKRLISESLDIDESFKGVLVYKETTNFNTLNLLKVEKNFYFYAYNPYSNYIELKPLNGFKINDHAADYCSKSDIFYKVIFDGECWRTEELNPILFLKDIEKYYPKN